MEENNTQNKDEKTWVENNENTRHQCRKGGELHQ